MHICTGLGDVGTLTYSAVNWPGGNTRSQRTVFGLQPEPTTPGFGIRIVACTTALTASVMMRGAKVPIRVACGPICEPPAEVTAETPG